jgi:hypothetical protein
VAHTSFQIKILKEKLDFTNNQLEEKDRQLDHYKQLVKTLKDVLSEVSGRGRPGFGNVPNVAIAVPISPTSTPTLSGSIVGPGAVGVKGEYHFHIV